ncbi:uncharacterized protein F4822DRAFT_406119 [Hypoxylon trugodes]|uniref:uncharacterized protein n=1 Tax=Hypoxylon trugodes TaxID=326681 RepID=UPI0021939140|nr:uncharacterized protein F4822DRAFT_406119 [Hypoxylon trugodes]KAI1387312.1 hypothetical protein F4822DRAFT_406119 [Hypoxylon trugodes]
MTTPTSRASDDTPWRDHRSTELTAGVPQLNCELCRRRKIKCDKSSPCSNCVKSGVQCVPIYRKRLPRGRYVTPRMPAVSNDGADELRDRIRRLEALISDMNDLRDTPASTSLTPPRPGPKIRISHESTTDIGEGKQVGRQFWAHIAEEIEGLRDIVGNSSDDEESIGSTPRSASGAGLRILGIGSSGPAAIQATESLFSNHTTTAQLCEVFLRQVDPVFKLLHRPSLSRFMLNGQRYLTYEPDHICSRCVRSVVCYSALASMTENQCQNMFGICKSAAIVEYRAACEAALEQSELLTTNDITVLQAFMLYLVARRTEDPSRAVWTMVALTVRIARALSLHIDNHTESFFNQQMRRRLWHTICVLDLQSSFEQASEPLIGPNAISSILPLNINDSEFDVDTSEELQNRAGLTDMTYALVTYYAQRSGRLLNFYDREGKGFNWAEREDQVYRFEQSVLNLLKFCDPETSDYAWFAFHGAQSRVASMRLSALRPLRRVGSKPTRRAQLTNLLNVALEVLEKVNLIRTDPRGEGFRWYIVVQWHALAIAITECFVCAEVGILRAAWPVIEECYEDYKALIEDNRQGMLKKPLEKLMGQARKRIIPLLTGQNLSQMPSQLGTSPSVAYSATPSGYPSPVPNRSLDAMAPSHAGSAGLPTTQRQPQHSMDLDFNFNAMGSFMPFDHTASPSSLPQWFTPQGAYAQGRDASSSPEGSSGAGDVSWRTWEDFVSGLSFEDFPHQPPT